jgi:transposase InsO family protein
MVPRRSSTPNRAASSPAQFTVLLAHNKIKISMDGQGCWCDNVFVERLWHYSALNANVFACYAIDQNG